jgi:glycosidase
MRIDHKQTRRLLLSIVLSALACLCTPLLLHAEGKDYSKLSARSVPGWVRTGVIYEIFPRQFSASGDFNGITAQLDRLKRLGIDTIWLMPIHPLGRIHAKGALGSPYAVRDYYAINPEYGTAADLHRLVAEAHRRNMHVIIDIVANHTSWDSVMMKTPEFYRHDAAGRIVPPNPDWDDVAQLNYDNPNLRRYMIDMLKHWVHDFELDGFRCDAAGMVPTDFWEQARSELDAFKPGLFLLAEWDSPALLAQAFDADYSWEGYKSLSNALLGLGPASAVRDQWLRDQASFERGALHMRFSDNHDEIRAISRFGQAAALGAAGLMFTLDGVPLIYNGMEVGDTAESSAPLLFEKAPISWQMGGLRPQFPQAFQQLIGLRHTHAALTDGELVWLHNSDEAHVLTFLRRNESESLLIAVNLSAQPFAGVTEFAQKVRAEITPVVDGSGSAQAPALPALSLAPWQYRIFQLEAAESR